MSALPVAAWGGPASSTLAADPQTGHVGCTPAGWAESSGEHTQRWPWGQVSSFAMGRSLGPGKGDHEGLSQVVAGDQLAKGRHSGQSRAMEWFELVCPGGECVKQATNSPGSATPSLPETSIGSPLPEFVAGATRNRNGKGGSSATSSAPTGAGRYPGRDGRRAIRFFEHPGTLTGLAPSNVQPAARRILAAGP